MAGVYQTYTEYRDSGLDWLGDVPCHWTVSKFGYVKTVLTDYTANGSFADLKKNVVYRDEPSHARLVRLTDLRVNLENQNGVWIDEDAYNYLRKSALFGGEFLLANVGAYAGLFYQMPENKGNASLAPNMFMAKFDGSKILREFMAYVGQSQSANEQLRLNATASSAQPKLNKDDFKSVRFTFPSINEQQKIANFLDHETAKIDTLIEKQQQLIKLLKEKRQAVISHAVTKGLNPNAPLRDSGVEWLGEVPAHWGVSNMDYALDAIGDVDHYMPKSVEKGIPYVMTGDLKELASSINFEGCKQVSHNDYLKLSKKMRSSKGDVIMARYATIGTVSYIDVDADFLVSYSCVTIKPNLSKVVGLYLYYYFKSDAFLQGIQSQVNTNTQGNVGISDLKKIKIAIPAMAEQLRVIEYLQSKISKLNDIADRSQAAINLMQERRTALISAAVTGKIDVRNWVAPAHPCARDISASLHVTAADQT